MEVMQRKSRIITEIEAANLVKDGMTVYIGGFTSSSHPMAIVRQIIKNRVKNLTVVGAATSSMEVDLMIAAGCVKTLIAPYVGIEGHIGIAPFFRKYFQDGMLKVWELDESMHYTALRAGACDLPYLPDRSAVGTDYTKLNPDLKEYRDPIKGEKLIAVPAVAPDIAFIYAEACDAYGNCRIKGSGFGDRTGARASNMIVVQAEQIISNEEIRMQPERTTIHNCERVVRAPFGAHPFNSPGHYIADDTFLAEYVKAGVSYLKTSDRTLIDAFLKKYVYEPETHLDYLELIGVKRLCSLGEF
ncbi:MAG: CoA-transferase [Evtepia sp.]